MDFVILDLARLQEKRQQQADGKEAVSWLAPHEQQDLDRLTSGKRRREWFAGRMAAKRAGADLLARSGEPLPWSELAVLPNEHGRPNLAAGSRLQGLPDISISHSSNLAGALAVSPGWCGMDIQEITERVVKVRDRFCTPAEETVIHSCFSSGDDRQLIGLTMLWAAKEALRKVAATPVLPGFLDLLLTEINGGAPGAESASWRFVFRWKHGAADGILTAPFCSVAVCYGAGYALALTARKRVPF
jgi:phosphopantetheinyl transferase